MRASVVSMLFAVSTAWAAPVPKELKKGDLGRLAGVWVRTGSSLNGGDRAPADGSSWKFDTRGNAAVLYQVAPPREGVRFRLDPAASPKTFDWIAPWGSWYGVYELDGDTFTVYLSGTGGEKGRNRELKTGPSISMYSFERSTAAK